MGNSRSTEPAVIETTSSGAPARPIVIGVDFAPPSDRALDHAMAVARKRGVPLVLTHVALVPDADEGTGDTSGNVYRAILRLRLAEARRRLAARRDLLAGQGVELSQVIIEDMPDTGLVRAAQELDASLIVVGSHDRTGAARVVTASVAELVVRLASCSVLLARGDAVAGGYRRVVVGTDFSPQALPALERALELAAPGADVRVVHGWSLTTLQDGDPSELVALAGRVDALRAEENSRYGRELVAARERADVRLRFDAVEGAPAQVLVDAAREADLVVVGSHGRRGLRRWLVGSVAESVARHAPCSVLVAR
jgi:nucleotide-binding universal stress UspA family protein